MQQLCNFRSKNGGFNSHTNLPVSSYFLGHYPLVCVTVTLERGRHTEVQGYLVLYTFSERATGTQAGRQQGLATVLFSYKKIWSGLKYWSGQAWAAWAAPPDLMIEGAFLCCPLQGAQRKWRGPAAAHLHRVQGGCFTVDARTHRHTHTHLMVVLPSFRACGELMADIT